MIIDCETCHMRDVACHDCVVTVLLGRSGTPVDFDEHEHRAVGALADHGLVPPLRLVPRIAITQRGIA